MKRLVKKLFNTFGYEIRRSKKKAKNEEALYSELYPEESIRLRRFYNIGAGSFSHQCWTNVDKGSEYYSRVQNQRGYIDWDLYNLKPLPIDNNCAELVYTSHTIEHVSDEACDNFFKEAFRVLKIRVLKTGGYLRVTCPDTDLAYRALSENDRHFFYWIEVYSRPAAMARINITKRMDQASLKQVFLYWIASNASTLHGDGASNRITDDEFDRIFLEMKYEDALDYCTSRCSMDIQNRYPYNHVNWWNRDKIIGALRKAGFRSVYHSGFGQSHSPVLRNTAIFDNTYPKSSLYVEATK